jgi:hypothetical protein
MGIIRDLSHNRTFMGHLRLSVAVPLALFVLAGAGCGLYDNGHEAGSSDDSSREADCDDICWNLAETCFSFEMDRWASKNYCIPKCRSMGCQTYSVSTRCDEMFQEACSL